MKGMGFEWGFEEENFNRTPRGRGGKGWPEAVGRRLGSGGKGMWMRTGHSRVRSERKETAEKEADTGLYGTCNTNVRPRFYSVCSRALQGLSGSALPEPGRYGSSCQESKWDWRRVKPETA